MNFLQLNCFEVGFHKQWSDSKRILLWLLLSCEIGNVVVFWIWDLHVVVPYVISVDADISGTYGIFWKAQPLRKVFVGSRSGFVIAYVKVGIIKWGLNSISSKGVVFSEVSFLLVFGFEIPRVVYLSESLTMLQFCFDFGSTVFLSDHRLNWTLII